MLSAQVNVHVYGITETGHCCSLRSGKKSPHPSGVAEERLDTDTLSASHRLAKPQVVPFLASQAQLHILQGRSWSLELSLGPQGSAYMVTSTRRLVRDFTWAIFSLSYYPDQMSILTMLTSAGSKINSW